MALLVGPAFEVVWARGVVHGVVVVERSVTVASPDAEAVAAGAGRSFEKALSMVGCGLEDEWERETGSQELEGEEALSLGVGVGGVDEAEDAAVLVGDVAVDLDEGVAGSVEGADQEAARFAPAGLANFEVLAGARLVRRFGGLGTNRRYVMRFGRVEAGEANGDVAGIARREQQPSRPCLSGHRDFERAVLGSHDTIAEQELRLQQMKGVTVRPQARRQGVRDRAEQMRRGKGLPSHARPLG